MDCNELTAGVVTARQILRRIDTTARALGYRGDGDTLDPPRLETVEGLNAATVIFLEAKLGRIPEHLRAAAVRRCQTIVATSVSRGLHEPDPSGRSKSEPTGSHSAAGITRRALSVARKLGLDGDLRPEHDLHDLVDGDAYGLACQLHGQYLDEPDLPEDLRRHGLRVAASLACNSSPDRVAKAHRVLKSVPNVPEATDDEVRRGMRKPRATPARKATTPRKRTAAEIRLGLPARESAEVVG